MKNHFSKRTYWDLTPNALTKAIQKRKEAGLPILDLTESNPTRCGFKYPVQEISKALTQLDSFVYKPHPKGSLMARKVIAEYYREKDIEIDPEQIFLTASTSEAYSFIFRLIADPSDSILVPCPSYPLFNFLANLDDLELKTYPLIYEKGWHIDLNSLKASLQKNTRAVLLIHPNNPTGSYVKPEEIQKLIQIAKGHNLVLIADEVFHDYFFEAPPKKSFASVSEILTFTLNGLSKMVGLPQMKLGWIVVNGPEDLLKEAIARLEIITDTYLSVNTPIQQALPEILKNRTLIQEQIQSRLAENRKFLISTIQQFPTCEYLQAEGGWYAILKVPYIKSDEEWALSILEHEGVLIHPGHFYNFDEEGYLVLSLLTTPETFQKGIKKVLNQIMV